MNNEILPHLTIILLILPSLDIRQKYKIGYFTWFTNAVRIFRLHPKSVFRSLEQIIEIRREQSTSRCF